MAYVCIRYWSLTSQIPSKATFSERWSAYHVVARQQFLQEVCLCVLHRLHDELIVLRDVEDTAAGAGVGEFLHRLVTHRQLQTHRDNASRDASVARRITRFNHRQPHPHVHVTSSTSSRRFSLTHQEVVGLDAEQFPEVSECDRRVRLKPEVAVVMCRRQVTALPSNGNTMPL